MTDLDPGCSREDGPGSNVDTWLGSDLCSFLIVSLADDLVPGLVDRSSWLLSLRFSSRAV